MKLWSGRFLKKTNKLVDEFNASIGFDYQLASHDIKGSIAHVKMLVKCNLITHEDGCILIEGLESIDSEIKKGKIKFKTEDEDIHMNIERILHAKVGDAAGKLHSGRSRNDQAALDLHLYLRTEIFNIIKLLHQFLKSIYFLAENNIDTLMPGYTHLQRAEPIRFAHHMLAYFNMFSRDVFRMIESFQRVNQSPLGAGALAGSGLNVDPEYTAKLLNFDAVYNNSLDAVSDRDFVIEFLTNASIIMMHFSRLSEEIILWSTQEFSFVELDDEFCTGSSMMPQKKNPDVCELVRGKTGRIYGSLMGVLTVMKGLPLAYNKDMQEDKEGLFDAVKTLKQTLIVYTPMLFTMKVNIENMRSSTETDYTNATNLANYLTKKGLHFRKAHEITGKIVQYCISNSIYLNELKIERYMEFCDKIDKDVYDHLNIETVIESHQAMGGTSKKSVQKQIKIGLRTLKNIENWLSKSITCCSL